MTICSDFNYKERLNILINEMNKIQPLTHKEQTIIRIAFMRGSTETLIYVHNRKHSTNKGEA